jgi:PPK2 family polyphosphate:nucleotide phosphotransferase
MTEQIIRPKPHQKILLKQFDADYHADKSKNETRAETKILRERLAELQTVLYAQGKYSLLIVLQAMDAGGKDGTIKRVFSGVNPQGFRIANFKKPTDKELAHDFLWRVHQEVPPKGYIGIFNRSHYEDVLIVRVNKILPKSIWEKRYDHINAFEKLLADSGVTILKFYLHISKEEQKERFQDRLDKPAKNWKFSIGDLPVREKWDDYMRAYEDALGYCNSDYAPWHIIPANRKWYRNYIITKTIVEALEAMSLEFPEEEVGLENIVIPD